MEELGGLDPREQNTVLHFVGCGGGGGPVFCANSETDGAPSTRHGRQSMRLT